MSDLLFVDEDTVSAVLLPDGWHDVEIGTFSFVSLAFTDGDLLVEGFAFERLADPAGVVVAAPTAALLALVTVQYAAV